MGYFDPNTAGRTRTDFTGATTRYDYSGRYPEGMDLDPTKRDGTHSKLLTYVMERAYASRSAIQTRFERWKQVDQALVGYIPLSEEEKLIKQKDPRRPVSIMVPELWAARETVMTYMVSAFLTSPYFRYKPRGPEDRLGVIMLEKVVEAQALYAGMGLDLYTAIADSLTYGVGVACPIWNKDESEDIVEVSPGAIRAAMGVGKEVRTNKTFLWEGNRLFVPTPYDVLFDPSVPPHKIEEGEFFGWVEHTNLQQLLRREAQDEGFFNVKYLKEFGGESSYFPYGAGDTNRDAITQIPTYTHPCDVVHMYVDLMPSEIGLVGKDQPQLWRFAVAGDGLVVSAKPLQLTHGKIPAVANSPFYDGRNSTPISLLEMLIGMQEAINFFLNSHIENIRKAIMDMFVVDPSHVELQDLLNPSPGKVIRVRRSSWGRPIGEYIEQLKVNDVTTRHMGDAGATRDLLRQLAGVPDIIQGFVPDTGERRSATEMAGARSAAMTKMQKTAKITSMMFMQPLARMIAYQTQQFMSEDTYSDVLGRWEEVLVQELEQDPKKNIKISPATLQIPFDVVMSDGSSPDSANAQLGLMLAQLIQGDVELRRNYNLVGFFQQVARISGYESIDDFRRLGVPKVDIQTAPIEQIQSQLQAGNIRPMEGV